VEVLINFGGDYLSGNYTFSSLNVFANGTGVHLFALVPILSAATFIKNFNDTKNGGFYRYESFRSGKTKLITAKFSGGVISGGLVFLAGYILFGIIAFILFPTFQSYEIPPELQQFLFLGNPPLFILYKLIGVFFLGMLSTLPAILLSAFIRNMYVILSATYMGIYLYNLLLGRAIFELIRKGDFEFADRLSHLFPHSIVTIAFSFNPITPIFQFVVILITFFLFSCLLRWRVDFSE
jgi:hypothetical protein